MGMWPINPPCAHPDPLPHARTRRLLLLVLQSLACTGDMNDPGSGAAPPSGNDLSSASDADDFDDEDEDAEGMIVVRLSLGIVRIRRRRGR